MRQNRQWTVVFVTGFRLFMQSFLLERHAYSACWMAPLIGGAIALPFVYFIAKHWQQRDSAALPSGAKGGVILFLALTYLLLDTAQLVLLYQEGTKFASLSSYPTAVLYLLLLLFALFVVRQPRTGVFGLGTALKTALLVCLGLLMVFRLPDVRIARLAPLFGGGASALLRAGASVAGYGFCFLIWLSYAPDFRPRAGTICGMWLTACFGAAVFTAIETMISPISPGEPSGLYLAVSRLLASGRSQTSLQLILYLVWFSLMFISVCLNLKCMSVAAGELLHKRECWPIQIGVVLAASILSNVCEHTLGENLRAFLDVPGPFRCMLLIPLLLMVLPQRRRKAVSA